MREGIHTGMYYISHVSLHKSLIAAPPSRKKVSYVPTDEGDRTSNNYDCQNFQQVFTGVPVHIKHVITGVPKISDKFSSE